MEKKAQRGRIWKEKGNEQFLRGMCVYFTFERAEARKILAEASREKQEGYKVSGNRNPFSERFWNKSREVLQRRMIVGRFLKRKILEGRDIRLSGPSKEFAKLTRRWQRMKSDVRALCRKFLRKSLDFLRGRRNGWSHPDQCAKADGEPAERW